MTEQKRRRFEQPLARTAVFALEQFAQVQDSVRLPLLRKKEQTFVRATYKLANRVAESGGLQRKVYRRISDSGSVESVE